MASLPTKIANITSWRFLRQQLIFVNETLSCTFWELFHNPCEIDSISFQNNRDISGNRRPNSIARDRRYFDSCTIDMLGVSMYRPALTFPLLSTSICRSPSSHNGRTFSTPLSPHACTCSYPHSTMSCSLSWNFPCKHAITQQTTTHTQVHTACVSHTRAMTHSASSMDLELSTLTTCTCIPDPLHLALYLVLSCS